MTVKELVKVLQKAKIDVFVIKSLESRDGAIRDYVATKDFKNLDQEYGDYIVKQVDIFREPKEGKFLYLELKE